MDLDAHVAAFRRFNRFHTAAIGLVGRYLDAPWSLTEARILYELGTREAPSAVDLIADLKLDAGYLSRLLKRFASLGLIERTRSATDGRRAHLTLTVAGREAFERIDRASRKAVSAMIGAIPQADRDRLVGAMATIETILSDPPEPIVIRRHRPGDLGAVVAGQARLYHAEYGWDGSFEALVAEVAARFIQNHDPVRERAFIAERAGQVVGSVFCCAGEAGVAKLRMLYVDRAARGFGLGRRLVADCIAFAREAGYARMELWTNDVLTAARTIYQAQGFTLVSSEKHHSFGKDLVGETWVLDLQGGVSTSP